jgi:Mor family transcriptional regulator
MSEGKVTQEVAREMRRLRLEGMTLTQLERRFKLSRQWVIAIVKNRAWREPPK